MHIHWANKCWLHRQESGRSGHVLGRDNRHLTDFLFKILSYFRAVCRHVGPKKEVLSLTAFFRNWPVWSSASTSPRQFYKKKMLALSYSHVTFHYIVKSFSSEHSRLKSIKPTSSVAVYGWSSPCTVSINRRALRKHFCARVVSPPAYTYTPKRAYIQKQWQLWLCDDWIKYIL